MMVWGVNVVALKVIVTSFPPVTITSLRVFTASLTVLIALLLTKNLRRITKQEALYTFLAAVFGVLGHHFFLAIGISNTTASNAGLILALVPLATALLASIFLGNRITFMKFIGILLGLVGVSFIVLKGSGQLKNIAIGDIYVLGAVIAQAISFIFIKKGTDTLDARQLTGMMLFIGSILLFITSLLLEPGRLNEVKQGSSFVWLVFLGSAVFATGIGHMLYNSVIPHLGAGETSIFINMVPFFSLISSSVFLGEIITSTQVKGFFLIMIGVLLGSGSVELYIQSTRQQKMSNLT